MRPFASSFRRERDAPPDAIESQEGVRFRFRDLGFFVRFVRPVWKIGAISIVLVIVTTGISSLLPMTSKVFIDFVIMRTGYGEVVAVLTAMGLGAAAPTAVDCLGSLDFVVLSMVVAGAAYGLLNVLQEYLSTVYQQEMTFNLQTALFERVLRFPLVFLKSRQTGYLMSRVSDDVAMMQFLFSDAVTQIISSLFYLAFVAMILTSLNVRLAAFIVGVMPAYLVVRYFFSGRIRALSYREREYNSEVSRTMQEALSGIEVVKSYVAEKKESEKVSHSLRDVVRTRIVRSVLMTFARTFMGGTMFVLLLVVMVLGAGEIRAGTMTIGDYVTFISYILFLSNSINMLYRTYLTFQPAFASMYRLREMFDIMPEFDPEGTTLSKPAEISGNVRFDHVSFAYGSGEPVLRDVSFEVGHGGSVALVGRSGAGKTTLASLLLKLYAPQSGAIYLDGRDLQSLDHAWLRQQISVVSQDVFLFNDTVENNIKYGRPDAPMGDIVEAAKKAHVHDFIESLPRGYDTVIGERGARLSVGQRQRISIARAFLKDSPILILDEPTSAIDAETEQYLKNSLGALMRNRTTIIISHRMSLNSLADRVVVIDGGRIAQDGTHAELADNAGLYHKLRALDGIQGRDGPRTS